MKMLLVGLLDSIHYYVTIIGEVPLVMDTGDDCIDLNILNIIMFWKNSPEWFRVTIGKFVFFGVPNNGPAIKVDSVFLIVDRRIANMGFNSTY